MNKMRLAAFAAVTFAFAPAAAFAQPTLAPSSSLTGDDPDGTLSAFGDAYGAGADAWEDWLFVGAPRETAFRDGADMQDGAVYVYRKDGGGNYVFQQKLTMPGSAVDFGDRFGGGVDAEAGWLFVAAANDQDFPGLVDPREGIDFPDPFTFAGQVHVYKLNGGSWNFVQTLISPTPKSNGAFGARSQATHIALRSDGKTAVIGEMNNFEGGVGQLHAFRIKKGAWEYVESIDPPANIDTFGDGLVFASNKYLVAGAADLSDDVTTVQGFALVYQAKGSSGKFFQIPEQTIPGAVVTLADCNPGGSGSFGDAGLAAGGGVVAIAEPCVDGAAGANTGRVEVYRLAGGPSPLAPEASIEGDEPNLFMGINAFGSRNAVAVSNSGERILIGTGLAPNGFFDQTTIGDDVRVYADDPALGWTHESNLATATPASADFRAFGDTVFFADDETAFIRENNFIDPVVTGLKGQGLFFNLTP